MKETIDKIIFTLSLINVHGVEDMSRMLGCIRELQALELQSDKTSEPESEKE